MKKIKVMTVFGTRPEAIMAPTAILATQHYENFKNLLDELDIKCELLISGITKKKKEDILESVKKYGGLYIFFLSC